MRVVISAFCCWCCRMHFRNKKNKRAEVCSSFFKTQKQESDLLQPYGICVYTLVHIYGCASRNRRKHYQNTRVGASPKNDIVLPCILLTKNKATQRNATQRNATQRNATQRNAAPIAATPATRDVRRARNVIVGSKRVPSHPAAAAHSDSNEGLMPC